MGEIKQSLTLQKEIRDANPHIECPEPKKIAKIWNDSETRLEYLEQTKEGENNKNKILHFSEKLNINKQQLQESFLKGLKYTVKSMYKINPKFLVDYDENYYQNIDKLITGYTLNFRSALKNIYQHTEQGLKISTKAILNIASHPHRVSPNIITKLKNDFPEFDDWIITTSITGNPKNPGKFLENAHIKINYLREKYPNVDKGLITKAVIKSPKSSEYFLHNTQENIKTLHAKYPEVNIGFINHVVSNYKEPEKTLLKMLKKEVDLSVRYPKINNNIIKRAVISYPDNSENFIKKTIENIDSLKRKYPEVDYNIIERSVLSHTSNPENFINQSIAKYKDIKEKHPDIPNYICKRSIHFSNPEEFVVKAMEIIKDLKERYPDTRNWVIKMAVTNYFNNAEDFIQKVQKTVKFLTGKYKNDTRVTPTLINRASIHHPSNPDIFIKEYLLKR